jgi:hypothetical protein
MSIGSSTLFALAATSRAGVSASSSVRAVHRKWYKTSAEEGCVYLISRGARVKFKVVGNEPYRHLFVVMPGGFYPADKFER